MTAIFAIVNTAWAVVKMRPEKKVQVCTGFEPMTSAIPAHCSTNWANKPTGSWSLCWYQINSYLLKHCSLLQRSQSYSRLYLQFIYMTFLYSQSFKFQLVVNLSSKMVFLWWIVRLTISYTPTICHNINQLWSVWFNITIIPDNMRNVCVDMYLYTCKIDQSPPTGLISGPTWTIWSQILWITSLA